MHTPGDLMDMLRGVSLCGPAWHLWYSEGNARGTNFTSALTCCKASLYALRLWRFRREGTPGGTGLTLTLKYRWGFLVLGLASLEVRMTQNIPVNAFAFNGILCGAWVLECSSMS